MKSTNSSCMKYSQPQCIDDYTAKNYELQQVVENRIERCCVAHIVVKNIVQHCYTRLWASFRLNNLFNIVDNIDQYGQHIIVQSCFQQLVIFLRVQYKDHVCTRVSKVFELEHVRSLPVTRLAHITNILLTSMTLSLFTIELIPLT